MTQIAYRDWKFDCDVVATRTAYEAISAGGVETCECVGCKNFLTQRETVFPEELMKLFADLGVDYRRDAEIYHISRLPSGLHQYGGWFHFVGEILKQPNRPVNLDDHFTVDFIRDRALAAKAFENLPLVQIELTAEIPWALPENEID